MKPYTKNGLRKISILSTVILSIFILIHCKKDSDNNTNLLLALAVLNANKAEFKLTSANSLAAARITNSRQSRIQSSGAGLLVDLAGENPLNYGDGAEDGLRIILSLLLQRV
ncbi:hypothetical protein IQ65_04665 [Leptospira interrogans serovar Lai]|nr:hypothetical protein IQ65_04665 [Leptospira interrogans serovar Lai]